MLRKSNITSVIPVTSIDSCKSFYEEKLGLLPAGTTAAGEYLLKCESGAEIALREIPDVKPTGMTEISFHVDNIDDEINDLEAKGVKFEDYNDPAYKTNDHHVFKKGSLKAAWFKDPCGNVLCLHEQDNTVN